MNTEAKRNTLKLNREQREGSVVERVHKVLANAGLGSRRALEERIEAGEVRVNGAVAEIGSSIRSGDRVEMDGKAYIAMPFDADETQVLIYHKPEGELTTNDDPEGRATIFERLPRLKEGRWIAVGRLDMNTTGILLVTNDGELANKLMHPSSEVEREYICRVSGSVNDETLEKLKRGITLEDGPANFDDVGVISIGESHSWIRVVLSEGRNREVRRMWEAVNHAVSRLKRIRYGNIELPRNLRRGHTQAVEREQIAAMREQLGLEPAPQSLTLEPVIGVRRAAKSTNEFRPRERSSAWSGEHADEARELRAFDRVRDDSLGQRPARKPRGAKPGGPRTSTGPRGERKPRFTRADAVPGTGKPARGDRFERGERGPSGERGARGERIERGPRGDRNERGPRSERGPRGEAGFRGERSDNRFGGPSGGDRFGNAEGRPARGPRDANARGPRSGAGRSFGNDNPNRVGGATVFADGSTFSAHAPGRRPGKPGGPRRGGQEGPARNEGGYRGDFQGQNTRGQNPRGPNPRGAGPRGPNRGGGNFRGGPRGGNR